MTRPAAYPSDLEVQLPLEDGRTVLVRPVVPDDAPMLVRQLEHADPDTIYQRFFRYPVHLDAETLDHMTRLDYHDRLALAAFAADGEGVAIARYEIIEPGLAEVAVVVQPEWRLLGLGTALLEMLEGAAAGAWDNQVHRGLPARQSPDRIAAGAGRVHRRRHRRRPGHRLEGPRRLRSGSFGEPSTPGRRSAHGVARRSVSAPSSGRGAFL